MIRSWQIYANLYVDLVKLVRQTVLQVRTNERNSTNMKVGKSEDENGESPDDIKPVKAKGNVSLVELVSVVGYPTLWLESVERRALQFRYASAFDLLLLTTGTLVATGTGAGFPFVAVQ